MKYFKIFIFISFLFTACNTIDVYEKTVVFPKHLWSSKDTLSFNFKATDSLAYYNIYLVLRHTEAYHFNNIWFDFTSSVTNQKSQTQRMNIVLANANGWMGSAMDDIIEQRILLFRQPIKLMPGDYTFKLQQVMREDPLQNVLNAGVRVEKVVQ